MRELLRDLARRLFAPAPAPGPGPAPPPGVLKRYAGPIVIWLVLTGLSAIAARYGLKTPAPGPFPVPFVIQTEDVGERKVAVLVNAERFDGRQIEQVDAQLRRDGFDAYHGGWVRDDAAVQAFAATLPTPVFADTPAGQVRDDELPASVYLWHAYEGIWARPPPCKNQNPVGSCVAFGTATAIERTMGVEIKLKGRPFEFKHLCEEVLYAGSRVEVGGGRIRGDGSNGSWAARFVRDWGVVPREKIGAYDLARYDPARCREWGAKGVPAELETVARQHPVQDVAQVRTWAEAKRALASGYGIAICSGQGFAMQRNAEGVCEPRGSWAHCMALDGYHVENGREYGHIENSWGPDAHRGPVGWGNPTTAGFWARSEVIERMLRSGDSWTFAAVKGFPARKIDWFAARPAPRRAREEALFVLAP